MYIKGLQEPDDYRRDKNHGESSLHEILCFVPQKTSDVFGSRHPVARQFHYERHRLTPESSPLHYQSHYHACQYTRKIQPYHHECSMVREKDSREKRIYRQLCRTAHERRKQDGHLPVALRRQCPARHNGRHGTAEAYQHRHYAPA